MWSKTLVTSMRVVLFVLFFCIQLGCQAQPGFPKPYGPQPEVGKAMPYFRLDNVTHYKNSSISLSDLKGSWTILDFWFTGCKACIFSFPKINTISREFKGQVNYILVGVNARRVYNGGGISTLYERLRKRLDLDIVSSYDSTLCFQWGILAMPHIIIIDPAGLVRYITDGRDMTVDKIRKLLSGDNTVTFYRSNMERPQFDACNRTGISEKILYQSLLAGWNGEAVQVGVIDGNLWNELPYLKENGTMNFSAVPLNWLYNCAYIGDTFWQLPRDSLYSKVYPDPVLELADKSPFQFDCTTDVWKGLYNYSLSISSAKASVAEVMQVMQEDLRRAFGYKVAIERRKVPVWHLVANPSSIRLKTKGGNKRLDDKGDGSLATGFAVENFPVEQFLDLVSYYIRGNRPPFFDRTGISFNIDVNIDANMINLEDVRKSLNKNGLDLVLCEEDMTVVVIKDPDQ